MLQDDAGRRCAYHGSILTALKTSGLDLVFNKTYNVCDKGREDCIQFFAVVGLAMCIANFPTRPVLGEENLPCDSPATILKTGLFVILKRSHWEVDKVLFVIASPE